MTKPKQKQPGMKIQYIPLSTLKPAPRNPKDHDLGAIILSLQRFGFVTPGVINETTGHIVVGHGRAEALLEMKRTGSVPPTRIRERRDKEWMVPFIRGIEFADDREAEAFVVADNKLSEIGGWDWGLLPVVLSELRDIDLLEVTGFDSEDVDTMMRNLQPPPEFPTVPNDQETNHLCPKCGYKWRGATK